MEILTDSSMKTISQMRATRESQACGDDILTPISKSTHIIEQMCQDPSYTYIASKNTRPADPAHHPASSKHPNTDNVDTTHPRRHEPTGPEHKLEKKKQNTIRFSLEAAADRKSVV